MDLRFVNDKVNLYAIKNLHDKLYPNGWRCFSPEGISDKKREKEFLLILFFVGMSTAKRAFFGSTWRGGFSVRMYQ